MSYIRTTQLEKRQNRLSLNLVGYNLQDEWHSHSIINNLRKQVRSKLPKGLFDPQDLEHQVLFRLTTYPPEEISNLVIDRTIEEQLAIILHRLGNIKFDLEYIFRGLSGKYRDLNIDERLELKNIDGQLIAFGSGRSFEVEFKKIEDHELINLFTEKLHYVHSARARGEAFGFFFVGDPIPWGIETTEPSLISKPYKKDALLAYGVDPDKAIEITRLYLLPGSPKNAISILDGQVGRYYKESGIEAMYTTTMPTYAKTKAATTAGGMKDVLLVKELKHSFVPIEINGDQHYKLQVSEDGQVNDKVYTHELFPTLYTVETFMRLNDNKQIQPLSVLGSSVIYINDHHRKAKNVLNETKFKIKDLDGCLGQLKEKGTLNTTRYIKDEFWISSGNPRIRLRKTSDFHGLGLRSVEVSRKYRLSNKSHVRTEVTEKLYSGEVLQEALSVIAQQGDYRLKNLYEKICISYTLNQHKINLNIYPFGAYLEVTGSKEDIEDVSNTLGLNGATITGKNADELYLDWHQQGAMLEELNHIIFGLESYE